MKNLILFLIFIDFIVFFFFFFFRHPLFFGGCAASGGSPTLWFADLMRSLRRLPGVHSLQNQAFGAPGGLKPLNSLLFWIIWRNSDEKPNIISYFL